MKVATIFRWSKYNKKLRLFRFMWDGRQDLCGERWVDYSSMFSIALMPSLFSWRRGRDEWHLTLLGISFHYHKSFGGRFV